MQVLVPQEGKVTDEWRMSSVEDALNRRTSELHEIGRMLGLAYVYIKHYVPVEQALNDGFDVDAWCESVEALAAEAGVDLVG